MTTPTPSPTESVEPISGAEPAHRIVDAPLVWIVLMLLLAFGPILSGMATSWFDEKADMEHGMLAPIAAAYMVWAKRKRLEQIAPRPERWGLLLVLWGALQATVGTLAQWIWISRTAFLVSLVGCLIALRGWRTVRELAYPLCTLALMIAPPTFVYERITLPLQLLASRLAEGALEFLGFSVLRTGNILELPGAKLSVEEACSGIRSLMALYFMCVLYNFVMVPSAKMRAVLLIAVAPIAILGNALRIVGTGIAGRFNPAWVHGGVHDTFGYVSVILASALCVTLHLAILQAQKIRKRRHA